MERSSGILLPISALPSPYGIGTLGKEAYKFVDYLKKAGQRYWQLLPLGPTICGDSPYTSLSSFAGNPFFIDLDLLKSDGLLKKSDYDSINWGDNPEQVNYDLIRQSREKVLKKAFLNWKKNPDLSFTEFVNSNQWVADYSLFMALKSCFDGKAWMQWPEDIRRKDADAVKRYQEELHNDILFYEFVQYEFYKQWNKLKAYAGENGIKFVGDIPIYVAMDSADVWLERKFFQVDELGDAEDVSGVPPDAFTEDGQFWGNPLYNYDEMKSDGYGWWIRRIDGASRLYDVLRIDHFRAFESYWAIPSTAASAREGRWKKGPGMELVGILTSWFSNMEFIAEDLGIITDDVRKLISDSKIPGMKVLEFAFDSKFESTYLPHNCIENSVCYAGTHDNDTVIGWEKNLSKEDRKFARDYMHITEDEGWAYGMIRTGMATPSKLFIMQMQDILKLGSEARMNIPGIAEGNWKWRMTEFPDYVQILNLAKTYCRFH